MDETWYAARAQLRALLTDHPQWSAAQYAERLKISVAWVKKWRSRFRAADPTDDHILWGRSRARKSPPPPTHPLIIERIIEMRRNPPEHLQRIPGPKALQYYLGRDPVLQEQQVRPLRSTRRIWQILRQTGCIAAVRSRTPNPRPLVSPYTEFEIDFVDVVTVSVQPDGKRQHMVEILNIVDAGTSLLVATVARDDYSMATSIETLADVFREQGVLPYLRLDRDPRFVGSQNSRDFPSAFMRFMHSLGVTIDLCPPHRPDLKPYVERENGTLQRECIAVHKPADLDATRQLLPAYQHHRNTERPSQARSCGNQPPRTAFPTLPALPVVPRTVDPDRWLTVAAKSAYRRKVKHDGAIAVGRPRYYVGRHWVGQHVVVRLDAEQKQLVVFQHQTEVKRIPLKGLYGKELPFEDYITLIMKEAHTEQKQTRTRAA